MDLKKGVEKALNRLLDPIRKDFEQDEEFKKVAELAYPTEVKPKKKKEKKIGTGYKGKKTTTEGAVDGNLNPQEVVEVAVGTSSKDAQGTPAGKAE